MNPLENMPLESCFGYLLDKLEKMKGADKENAEAYGQMAEHVDAGLEVYLKTVGRW